MHEDQRCQYSDRVGERIISLLFINKCYAKSNMSRRIGTKIPLYMKILLGGSIFFGVLLIVFGPIFLFFEPVDI